MSNTSDSYTFNSILKYDDMVEDSMRAVVKRTLTYVEENGLPGDHHFYITFLTTHCKVLISDNLREQFPEEMTIVLQHQFERLRVSKHGFSVQLKFNGANEHLLIGFEAITTFVDPSANFGLQFRHDTQTRKQNTKDSKKNIDYLPTDGKSRRKPIESPPSQAEGSKVLQPDNVVPLDAFRKNKPT